MGFFGTTVARLAIAEVFKAVLAEANSRLNPDEMVSILQQAEVDADTTQGDELFPRIDGTGANGYQKFLKFFKSVEVLTELQKPLNDRGKPDVDILLEAFKSSALENPDIDNCRSDLMPLWMKAFVESYFEQVKGSRFKVAKTQYLKQLSQRVNKVKFVGMAVPAGEVETQKGLVQIFVMPDVREKRSGVIDNIDIDYGCILDSAPKDLSSQEYQELKGFVQQKNLLQEQKKWAQRDRSAPRVPAPKVLNLTQKKAVLLGAPGSGKTMLSSYFALMLCQINPTQISLDAEVDWLPIFVRIRDWISKPEQGLLSYLRWDAEENLSINNLPLGFFEHWLERGQALILLDGLDEVINEAQRSKVAEKIETFLHRYQDNPAVITSRPAGYQGAFNLDEFSHYTLESFDDKQMETFIDHWYDSRLQDNKPQAERRKVDLQKAFARNDRIRLLARNPLLLTLITLIHRDGGELPKQRYKLYERAVETLLIQWDCARDIKLDPKNILFKSEDLLYVLKKIAYWTHTQGSIGETEGGTLIDKDELIRQLRTEIKTLKKCELHEATAEAKRFIDFIKERTGLLNEQGIDCYAFVHKTFQEYLTAEEIFYRADVEDDTEIILAHFRQHLHDQHWREVLLLLVSKLKGKKAQKAIQAVLDAGSEYEQWLHRDLLFAGWCLTEDSPELTVVARDWVGEILDRLVSLEVAKSKRIGSKIRGEVEKILHCFGETTLERVSLEKLQAQGDRIDRFQLLDFQLALGQEKEVIDTLLSLLDDENPIVRCTVASSFGTSENASKEMVRGLLSLLRDENSDVRYHAAQSLGKLENTSKEIMSILLSLLDDRNPNVRSSTAVALGESGNASPEVVRGLLLLLRDENSNVRYHAAGALGNFDNDSSEVINGLLCLLNDEDSAVRSISLAALGWLGNTSMEMVNGLLPLLKDENPNVRSSVVETFGESKNTSPDVVSGLIPLIGDNDSVVRDSVARALGMIGIASPEVVRGLLTLLGDEDSTVRSSAAAALGWFGNATPEVVSGLLILLDDESSTVRSSVTSALVQLKKASPEVVNCLITLLSDRESNIRSYAASALGEIGNASSEVIYGLISLLSVRYGGAAALVRLAKNSDVILPKILQWLEQNPNDDGIGNAIDCLWSIVVE
jgi:HEAT repeat protein